MWSNSCAWICIEYNISNVNNLNVNIYEKWKLHNDIKLR